MQRCNAETMVQIRNDANLEIKEMQMKNQTNLNQVQDMKMRSQADLQSTKNKLGEVKNELAQLDRMIKEKSMQQGKLEIVNENFKQVLGQKKEEINHKDGIIHQKEKSILILKRRTQELEKFKFVLDEKIQDLRRDIAPKELEIKNLRNKTKQMDQRLKKYNEVNASLGYMVEDLRVRQSQIFQVISFRSERLRYNDAQIEDFKNACHEVVQFMDDQQQLKAAVNERLYTFVRDQKAADEDVNQHIKLEYENQKKFLENSMHSLKKRLEVESQIHKEDNLKIMRDNMDLISKIKEVRNSIKDLAKKKRNAENNYKKECTKYGIKPPSKKEMEEQDPLASGNSRMRSINPRSEDDETLILMRKESDARQKHIEMLKASIE